jgi:hypothetical protein
MHGIWSGLSGRHAEGRGLGSRGTESESHQIFSQNILLLLKIHGAPGLGSQVRVGVWMCGDIATKRGLG